jgi:hypothetical protein
MEGLRPDAGAFRQLTLRSGCSAFNIDLAQRSDGGWEKAYFKGLEPGGEPAPGTGHRSRLRLRPFAD